MQGSQRAARETSPGGDHRRRAERRRHLSRQRTHHQVIETYVHMCGCMLWTCACVRVYVYVYARSFVCRYLARQRTYHQVIEMYGHECVFMGVLAGGIACLCACWCLFLCVCAFMCIRVCMIVFAISPLSNGASKYYEPHIAARLVCVCVCVCVCMRVLVLACVFIVWNLTPFFNRWSFALSNDGAHVPACHCRTRHSQGRRHQPRGLKGACECGCVCIPALVCMCVCLLLCLIVCFCMLWAWVWFCACVCCELEFDFVLLYVVSLSLILCLCMLWACVWLCACVCCELVFDCVHVRVLVCLLNATLSRSQSPTSRS